MSTTDFPGVRWHGHWVAPDVPEFVINPTSVGSDLPPAGFSRAQFRRVFDLQEVPVRVPLRVSADSRYVLWVNGIEMEPDFDDSSWVGSAPAVADLPDHPAERLVRQLREAGDKRTSSAAAGPGEFTL